MVTPVKILAALDYGDSSLEALRQARALAHEVGGTLAACHVLPGAHDLSVLFPSRSLVADTDTVAEDNQAREALKERARAKLGLELSEVFIERGSASAGLVRCAESQGADFIVVGSHERGALTRAVLGSVAERVVRHAHCSVLVARPPEKTGVVLAASDLSEPSLLALAAGAAAAKRSGAKLLVVSALEWSEGTLGAAAGMLGSLPVLPSVELQEQVREVLRSTLTQAMARAGAEGEARVLDGPPAATIVTCAAEVGAELIVIGTRGHTGLARLALGSVAEHVTRDAGCSVLVVRAAAQS
jgi:nucleotide-binding universal stress UspA family protein